MGICNEEIIEAVALLRRRRLRVSINNRISIPSNNSLAPLFGVSCNKYDEYSLDQVPKSSRHDSFQFDFGSLHLRLKVAKQLTVNHVKIECLASNSSLVVLATSFWPLVASYRPTVIFHPTYSCEQHWFLQGHFRYWCFLLGRTDYFGSPRFM